MFTEEAESERYRGILGVTTDPVVSSDIIKVAIWQWHCSVALLNRTYC